MLPPDDSWRRVVTRLASPTMRGRMVRLRARGACNATRCAGLAMASLLTAATTWAEPTPPVTPRPSTGSESPAPASLTPGDPAHPAPQTADDAFAAGIAAYRKGDYSAARAAFAVAYELEPSYRTAAVLGQTEEKLGHLPQAATLLNWALFHMDGNVEPETKARMSADLTLLKNRILTLELTTAVPFQEVLIDDLLFTSNSLRVLSQGNNTWTIYLEPSGHEVTVRSDGYPPQQRQVNGPAGTLVDWELRWQPVAAPTPVTRPPEVRPAPKPSSASPLVSKVSSPTAWQLPAAIATGSLAVVAAGFGVYSLHQYNVASDEFDTARIALQTANVAEPCGATAPAYTRNACGAVFAADRDTVTAGNRAIATFTTAGALALTSAALWLWWWNAGPGETPPVTWSIAPRVGRYDWGGALRLDY